MGRGLSDLQRHILVSALANVQAGKGSKHYPDGTIGGADLLNAEVLAVVYGFPLKRKHSWHLKNGLREYGDQKFSKSELGAKRYAAAHAALSRAITRLEQRGLVGVFSGVHSGWTGVRLTEAGVALAAELSVRCAGNSPTLNRLDHGHRLSVNPCQTFADT